MHYLTFAKLNKIRRCEIFCWLHTELSAAALSIIFAKKNEISNKSKNFKYSAGKGQPNPDTLSVPAAN